MSGLLSITCVYLLTCRCAVRVIVVLVTCPVLELRRVAAVWLVLVPG